MSLHQMVWDRGNELANVAIAMKTIVEMLGADSGEYNLTPEITNGLHHAILAIGALVSDAAVDLCEAADPDAGGAK